VKTTVARRTNLWSKGQRSRPLGTKI